MRRRQHRSLGLTSTASDLGPLVDRTCRPSISSPSCRLDAGRRDLTDAPQITPRLACRPGWHMIITRQSPLLQYILCSCLHTQSPAWATTSTTSTPSSTPSPTTATASPSTDVYSPSPRSWDYSASSSACSPHVGAPLRSRPRHHTYASRSLSSSTTRAYSSSSRHMYSFMSARRYTFSAHCLPSAAIFAAASSCVKK